MFSGKAAFSFCTACQRLRDCGKTFLHLFSVGEQHITRHVLIIYFSLSGQSRGLLTLLASGLRTQGVGVCLEQIRARKKICFPFGSVSRTIKMMLTTFFRLRIPIHELSPQSHETCDLIILAGPTWSYNPSGPILSMLDRDGNALFSNQRVLPLISCRGYYRIHDALLRWHLRRCGARLEKSLIFSHPVDEPWSTLGVFLKSAGYQPEKSKLLANRYHHFGHTTSQLLLAKEYGDRIGRALMTEKPWGNLSPEQDGFP